MSLKFSYALLAMTALVAVAPAVTAQTVSPEESSAPMMASGLVAPAPADADAKPLRLELSAGVQNLSNGYGNWRELGLRGAYTTGRHVIQGELSTTRRFNEDGSFAGVSDTYTFNDDWYGSLALGASDGAFYLPKYRIDAMLYRKWLPERNLVTSAGVGYYDAPDGHTDRSVSLGLAYYFQAPFIVEGGVRFNSSNPGAVRTHQQFLAGTYGRDKQDLVTARYAWGGEGYLAIGPATQLVDFDSEEASLTWRHWLTPTAGLLVGVNRYRNPLYTRSGATIGIFSQF